MPLRQPLSEFKRACNTIIEVLKARPELLSDAERLDVETDLTRLMTTILQAQRSKFQKP